MSFMPSELQKKVRYKIYLAVFDAYEVNAMRLNIATATMTNALGFEMWTWHVTSISHDALNAISNAGGKMPSPSLVRAHNANRIDTWRIMLEKKFEYEEFWDFFLARDKVSLVTRQEHGTGKISELVNIPEDMDLFRSVGYAARIRKKIEGVWVQETLKKLESISFKN